MLNKRLYLSKSGFTLIELLIVIAVLGVLASVVLVAINPLGQLAKTRNAGRKSDMRQIANALERYVTKNGRYPVGGWCNTAGTGDYPCTGNNPLQVLVTTGELKKLPEDPRNNQGNAGHANPYCQNPGPNGYLYLSDGVDYKLLAHCSPEGNVYLASDPFYDPNRPSHAWQISSPGANAKGW